MNDHLRRKILRAHSYFLRVGSSIDTESSESHTQKFLTLVNTISKLRHRCRYERSVSMMEM